MKKRFVIVITAILCFSLLSGFIPKSICKKSGFSDWKRDGAIKELIAYVEDVTNKRSKNYIPKEDRIAVFDLDGTLVGEQAPIYFEWVMFCQRVLDDPSFTATKEMKDLAMQILQAAIDKKIPENIEEDESIMFGLAFDDMTVEEYKEYVQSFLNREADGFDGLKYKDAYFRPMVQVLKYLEEHDFIIYICSGTDRDADRVLMDQFYHIPYYHVIGTDCYNEGSKHDDVNYLEYQYDNDEVVMRDSTRIIKNVKASKITQMYQEIGQKPVLAFGNSSGDQSMFTFTSANNKYKTAVFCIVPDDDVREYAGASKVEKLKASCEKNGWNVISMKDDFLRIYAEGVTKNPEKLSYTNSLIEKYKETQKSTKAK